MSKLIVTEAVLDIIDDYDLGDLTFEELIQRVYDQGWADQEAGADLDVYELEENELPVGEVISLV